MITAARGFVLSVIAAAIVATATLLALGVVIDGVPLAFSDQDLRFVWGMLAMSAVIGSGAMLLVCVPLTLLLSNVRLERSWSYPLFGFTTGVLATYLLFTPLPYDPSSLSVRLAVELALIGGLAGVAAGVVWWHGYRKSRANAALPQRGEGLSGG